jgi:MHS family alpha-ketoglutarate permease-like MFS transporter
MTTSRSVFSATPLSSGAVLRSIVSGSLGNLIEYFDWYVYAAFALYFAPQFFPNGDRTAQLMQTAAVFAVGFFVRPIGGWFFGTYADRHGRKAALLLSVMLMCGGSLIVALTPTYETIGVGAPCLLLLARLLQGLSLGGGYGTSATYLSEMAPSAHRGFYSSFQYVTIILGQLLALGLLVLLQRCFLSNSQLQAWGWRIPFAVGAVIAVLTLWLQSHMQETQSFRAQAQKPNTQEKGSLRELMKHPRALLTVVGLTAGGTVSFYTFTTYMQKYLVNTTGYDKEDATLIASLALLVCMVLQPILGLISDKVGRRPMLIAFGFFATLFTIPIMEGLSHKVSLTSTWLWYLAALLILSCYTAINAIFKAELFPAHIRALGVGLPYAVTVSIFGGSAEYLALWLKSIGHEHWFYVYVTACTFLSLVVAVTMTQSHKTSRIDQDV